MTQIPSSYICIQTLVHLDAPIFCWIQSKCVKQKQKCCPILTGICICICICISKWHIASDPRLLLFLSGEECTLHKLTPPWMQQLIISVLTVIITVIIVVIIIIQKSCGRRGAKKTSCWELVVILLPVQITLWIYHSSLHLGGNMNLFFLTKILCCCCEPIQRKPYNSYLQNSILLSCWLWNIQFL